MDERRDPGVLWGIKDTTRDDIHGLPRGRNHPGMSLQQWLEEMMDARRANGFSWLHRGQGGE